MAATSSDLLVLFKDLSGSCEKIFQLLNLEDREIALLVLRGRFFQLNLATETNREETVKHMRGKRPLETQEDLDIKTANKRPKSHENIKKRDDTATSDNKSETYEDLLVTVDVGDILSLPQSNELEEIETIDKRVTKNLELLIENASRVILHLTKKPP